MKDPENIEAIQNCLPDFMGFIFYKKSPRYVGGNRVHSIINRNKNTQTIGVFVNHPIQEVIKITTKYKFDFVQLHGNESVNYIKELSSKKVKLIKAFQIKENFNWTLLNKYVPYVQYFLFDTATHKYGGSGMKFNWTQLENYNHTTPFFLSGGIAIHDVQEIKKLNIPQLFALDINSKFEIEPGIKDIELVKKMIYKIRHERIISSK